MTFPFHRRPFRLSLPSPKRALPLRLLRSLTALPLTRVLPPRAPFRRYLHLRLRSHASQSSRSPPRKLKMSPRRTTAKTRPKTTSLPTKIWPIVFRPRRDNFRPNRRLERGKIPCSALSQTTFRPVRCPPRRRLGFRSTRLDHNTRFRKKPARFLATCTETSRPSGDLQGLLKDMVRIASRFQPT